MEPPIDVTAKGAVNLGALITCDGFVYGVPYRVQTHVHTDHMRDFSSSKGAQEIYMSKWTRELLIAEHNADMPYRVNAIGVDFHTPVELAGCRLQLLPSEHMLGGAQVAITLEDGLRVGYSSDFKWPLEHVIQVDGLVLDSTYGSPQHRRRYTQSQVNERFVDLVTSKLTAGPVIVQGFRGTLERALVLLDAEVRVPLLCSARCIRELDVYRRFGYGIGDYCEVGTDSAQEISSVERYIRLIRKGEAIPEIPGATVVTLSAYMSNPLDPVMEYSETAYSIAMTNHADFDGTLEYVKATGAKYVVTDNTRGGQPIELANEIRRCLGIEARPSSAMPRRDWGV